MTTAAVPPAIELVGIDKSFGPVHANKDVNLRVERGVIHGVIGENGAGKSTLMSILYGFYEADAGEIRINGAPVRIRTSREAIDHGIGMVHQHFMLVPPLTVLDNVMLGAEGGPLLAKGEAAVRGKLKHLASEYGLEVDPDAIVGELSVGLQQRVEILKALVRGAEILVLDEPTAVLTPAEADQLFDMLRTLKGENKTILFITHKLREIMALTDRVSVMRRGEMVATFETKDTSPPELADAMVGRKVILKVDKTPAKPGAVALEARDLVVKDDRGVTRVDKMSFVVREGEIVGIAGVAGNGQSELLEALAGIRAPTSGEILVEGAPLDPRHSDPRTVRGSGVGHVPEDRHRVGLIMPFEACESAMLGFHRERVYGKGVLFDRGAIIADEAEKMEAFDIRPRAPLLKTANFSGGNQQKIVLAREIERNPKVMLVGQPTRGVDIGAIEFIHKRIVALRDAGKAVLLVSVELDEIFALADRILVVCGGHITGERRPEATDARDLGLLMAGVTERAA
ncbi:MAG TPA: ABC transporter ATP-binding protein [Roseiarcus sp.]|nr:ABC transporter ATP-binding protein [Roseiarcus sp.]